jgi:gas vesicle protein
MNKRPFLFGLGVGIIVGAALLQLMLIGEKQMSSLDDFDKGT